MKNTNVEYPRLLDITKILDDQKEKEDNYLSRSITEDQSLFALKCIIAKGIMHLTQQSK